MFGKILSFAFIVLFSGRLLSQNLDSLVNLLKTNLHDTTRCRILNLIVDNNNDDKAWPRYNEEMRVVASRNLGSKSKPVTKQDSIYFFYNTIAINNKGLLALNQGQFKQAIALFNDALKLAASTNDFVLLGDINNNLGGLYNTDKERKQGLKYFFKSLEYRRKINDKPGICQVLTNIASSYGFFNERALSKKYFEEALQVAIEIGDRKRQAHIYTNIGVDYAEEGKIQEAINAENKAIEIFRDINELTGLAVSLHRLGNIYFLEKQFKKAEPLYNESYKICVEQQNILQLMRTVQGLYQLEKELHHPEKALDHYVYYVKLKDSINSMSNKEAAITQAVEFEYEKKKAIVQAQHHNEILLAEEREKRQKTVSWSVGAGLVLMLILVYLIYIRLRESNIQKKIIEGQKYEVESKNLIIEEKQKEIIDSINYAKRIQHTLLANETLLNEHIPDHFIYFKPKDIVSGDFYWAHTVSSAQLAAGSELFYIAVCDSTGHGVPGAFMSLLNISFLNEAINEKNIREPHLILNHVRKRLIEEISKDGGQDGMDAVLLCIEKLKDERGEVINKITYASANNAPLLVSEGLIIELGKDKMPVGKGEKNDSFTLRTIEAKSGNTIYLYTDGFADQFGGPRARRNEGSFGQGKKFKYKALISLLAKNSGKSMLEQQEVLETTFEEWRGKIEQVDDVCVIGIRL